MTTTPAASTDLQARISGFSPFKHPSQAVAILNAVTKDPSRFEAAIELLKDMAVAGINFKDAEAFETLEDVVKDLRVTEELRPESDAHLLAKIRVLHIIGTPKAVKYMAEDFGQLTSSDLRDQVWGEVSADESATGIHRSTFFVGALPINFNTRNGTLSYTQVDEYKGIQREKLFALAKDGQSEGAKAAYECIQGLAANGGYSSLKFLSEFGTREAYRDMKTVLEGIQSGAFPKRTGEDSLEVIVFDVLANPAAYRAYQSIASKDILMARYAIKTFEEFLPDEDAAKYIARIQTARTTRFEEAEAQQMRGRAKDEEYETYSEIAHAYADIDAARSMSMLARCKPDYVSASLSELAEKYDLRNHAIELLINRGTAKSVILGAYMMLEDHAQGRDGGLTEDQQAELQTRKKLAIMALAKLPEADVKKNSDFLDIFKACAQVSGFSNAELAEEAILALAGRRNGKSFSTITEIITQEQSSALVFGVAQDKTYVDFKAQPQLGKLALATLISLAPQHPAAYKTIRDIANSGDDNQVQEAFDYFQKDGSADAIEQVRHLVGKVDVFPFLKSLPTEQAIVELKKAFTQNAVGSLGALVDLRQDALSRGQNDTSAYDAPIIAGVRKLAGKDANLMSAIRNGDADKLGDLFDRLAAAKIIDVVPKFNAAVTVHECEKALHDAQVKMGCTLLKFPKRTNG